MRQDGKCEEIHVFEAGPAHSTEISTEPFEELETTESRFDLTSSAGICKYNLTRLIGRIIGT